MRALIFDLDGTLVDTVYAHIFAWQSALAEAGMPLEGWRIHRKIGMSGGLFTRAVARELGREINPTEEASLQHRHGELFRELLPERRPLPGGNRLLNSCTQTISCLASQHLATVPRSMLRWTRWASRRKQSLSSAEMSHVPNLNQIFSWHARNVWALQYASAMWSVMPFGICWQHVEQVC